ncbi:hypothetical protein GOP47_0013163 [Adiantum capillus-veneris]|uniref:Uncharacterized protein n=1 Tax=Adiantum capillus-veneris TaxID=13818 RepID=A0A9D4ZEA1_ADICA|nr:hypothetical protein GOP47_0013163 [Adiantum capillus-veneris]
MRIRYHEHTCWSSSLLAQSKPACTEARVRRKRVIVTLDGVEGAHMREGGCPLSHELLGAPHVEQPEGAIAVQNAVLGRGATAQKRLKHHAQHLLSSAAATPLNHDVRVAAHVPTSIGHAQLLPDSSRQMGVAILGNSRCSAKLLVISTMRAAVVSEI